MSSREVTTEVKLFVLIYHTSLNTKTVINNFYANCLAPLCDITTFWVFYDNVKIFSTTTLSFIVHFCIIASNL